ncbi:MAG: endo-1,4-beta-xylanase [Planctomycetes bacterium]|nr:endo-1,4-beta-xylanase [Planctomycetota bacterium]
MGIVPPSSRFASMAVTAAFAFLLGGLDVAAEPVVVPAGKLRVQGPGGPLPEGGWNLWSNGAVGEYFEAAQEGEIEIVVSAAGQPCQGVFPLAQWTLRTAAGQSTLGEPFTVGVKEFQDYRVKVSVPRGRFCVVIAFLNDAQAAGEDRNLLLKELRVTGAKLLDQIPSYKEACADGIRKHRMGTLVVQTAPNAAVKVTMLRHEFLFGTALAHDVWRDWTTVAVREKYLQVVRENFNHAVHENALKWYHAQGGSPGPSNWADADKVYDWCSANHIVMRGHCVYWGIEKYVQPWVKGLGDAALREALEKRGKEVAEHWKGRIVEFDLNNEMLHGDYYAKRLGEGITKEMFEWFKTAYPEAILYVNDYGILSGGDGPRYLQHIQRLLDQGAPIGGIGCQGHFGARMDAEHMRTMLDQLARFKLPIKITEYDMNTGDEQAKAQGLETVYRTCFSHPAVAGLLMWGFWEGAHWKPKAALWRKDFSPTPAAELYRKLVFEEWWTRFEGKADAQGRCEVPAFFGPHAVEANGEKAEVELPKAKGTVTVSVGKS